MKNSKFLKETRNMAVFEIESLIIKFFKDRDIIVSVSKNQDHFDVYISDYADNKNPKAKKLLAKDLQKYVDSLDILFDAEFMLGVVPTKYGMQIYIGTPSEDGHLLEDVQDNTGLKYDYVCTFCGKKQKGHGNDPYPLKISALERACDKCNMELVIPERLRLLRGNYGTKSEAVGKADVERETSNIVLDHKFIWLFSVISADGLDIAEGIEYIQDAIDILVNKNGTYLVAFPYIDPSPEDLNVDLVFADNPGPVIVYNRDEATMPKNKLEQPTNRKQQKEKINGNNPEGNEE